MSSINIVNQFSLDRWEANTLYAVTFYEVKTQPPAAQPEQVQVSEATFDLHSDSQIETPQATPLWGSFLTPADALTELPAIEHLSLDTGETDKEGNAPAGPSRPLPSPALEPTRSPSPTDELAQYVESKELATSRGQEHTGESPLAFRHFTPRSGEGKGKGKDRLSSTSSTPPSTPSPPGRRRITQSAGTPSPQNSPLAIVRRRFGSSPPAVAVTFPPPPAHAAPHEPETNHLHYGFFIPDADTPTESDSVHGTFIHGSLVNAKTAASAYTVHEEDAVIQGGKLGHCTPKSTASSSTSSIATSTTFDSTTTTITSATIASPVPTWTAHIQCVAPLAWLDPARRGVQTAVDALSRAEKVHVGRWFVEALNRLSEANLLVFANAWSLQTALETSSIDLPHAEEFAEIQEHHPTDSCAFRGPFADVRRFCRSIAIKPAAVLRRRSPTPAPAPTARATQHPDDPEHQKRCVTCLLM